jgi:hypothetical protein
MRLTIIPSDGKVYIDDVAVHFDDMAELSAAGWINAIQWDETAQSGWIEFHNDGFGEFKRNQPITALPSEYRALVASWHQKRVASGESE